MSRPDGHFVPSGRDKVPVNLRDVYFFRYDIMSLAYEGYNKEKIMAGKVIYQEFEREIDGNTGELLRESSKEVVRHPAEPPYVKLYIDDLCLLAEVPDALKKTLMLLLRKLDYDGYITLSQRYREAVCEKLEISSKTLRNRLTQLVSKKLLIKDGINEYQANPFYFARGNWRSIVEQRKTFQMRITYTEKGKVIETVPCKNKISSKLND